MGPQSAKRVKRLEMDPVGQQPGVNHSLNCPQLYSPLHEFQFGHDAGIIQEQNDYMLLYTARTANFLLSRLIWTRFFHRLQLRKRIVIVSLSFIPSDFHEISMSRRLAILAHFSSFHWKNSR